MSSNSFLEFIKTKFGDKLSAEDQLEVSRQLEEKYRKTKEGVETSLITPRTPTTGLTAEQTQELGEVQIGLDRKRVDLNDYRAQGQLGIRAAANDQDIARYGAMTDINTGATRAILGDYISARDDARNFYGDTHNREIAFSQGRNKQIFDYLNRGQDLQSRQMTQNLIMDLGKTAALLFS